MKNLAKNCMGYCRKTEYRGVKFQNPHQKEFENLGKLKINGKYKPENFLNTLDVSIFHSFTALCQRVSNLMDKGVETITSYLGAERVMPHYNVRGTYKVGSRNKR